MAKMTLTTLTLDSVVKTPVLEIAMVPPLDEQKGKYTWSIVHKEFGIFLWKSDSADSAEVVQEYCDYNGIIDDTPAVRAIRGKWDAEKVEKPKVVKKPVQKQAAALTAEVGDDVVEETV